MFLFQQFINAANMVLGLDGHSEIDAQVRGKICDLIYLKHKVATLSIIYDLKSDFFNPKRHTFLYACVTFSDLPSNISTMATTFF